MLPDRQGAGIPADGNDISTERTALPPPSGRPKKRTVREIVLDLAAAAGDGSIGPGDVAKVFAEERRKPGTPAQSAHRWSRIVRAEAIGLARAGEVTILRKGKPVDPQTPVKGAIRIRLAKPSEGTAQRRSRGS